MTNYQEDLILTSEDFACCGWKEVLTGSDCEDYSSISQAFSDAARLAISEDRQAHGKALSLLAQACSMMLSPDSTNEPFEPSIVLQDRRSPIPDDLSQNDIIFFAQIVDKIDDQCPKAHLLKARLADLVWLLQRPRDVKFALVAIDSYRSIPLDTETWIRDGDTCWQRAIVLARMLRSGAGKRLEEIEASIIKAFKSVTRRDGFLGFWLADLLKSKDLGRENSNEIAKKLESLGREFEDKGKHHKAREYFQASADWFKVFGDNEKSIAMTVKVAEGWIKEADTNLSSDQSSHIIAVNYYEKAIQTYRTIPGSMRAPHRVDDRIVELRKHLNESGKRALDEMSTIRSPGVDISQIVEDARNSVRGKTLNEALKAFVNLVSYANAKELRESAIELLHDFPLQALISTTVMSRDGRVTARQPGMVPGTPLSDEDEMAIHSKMVENYRFHFRLAVPGYIWPAQEVLLLEHRLREVDFINLARESPIVPIGRERLFGKALFAGYDGDFATALHILVPQIEHLVRYHLKQAEEQTTNLDGDGIENETGLSALMDIPQVEEIFGKDLSFEIKALFCDSFGPNLRNELAHGLLDDRAFYSLEAIYAWWFGLKLVFNTFWNALYNNDEQSEQGEE